jgi:hypothetical protein
VLRKGTSLQMKKALIVSGCVKRYSLEGKFPTIDLDSFIHEKGIFDE